MSNSNIVNVKLPAKLEMDFMQRVITDGYGMKGKSKWVGESVRHFMKLPDFEEYVEYAEELEDAEKSKLQSFYFDLSLTRDLKDAVIRVRRVYPHLEGIKSLIVRSSIIHRLFRVKEVYSRDSESNLT